MSFLVTNDFGYSIPRIFTLVYPDRIHSFTNTKDSRLREKNVLEFVPGTCLSTFDERDRSSRRDGEKKKKRDIEVEVE